MTPPCSKKGNLCKANAKNEHNCRPRHNRRRIQNKSKGRFVIRSVIWGTLYRRAGDLGNVSCTAEEYDEPKQIQRPGWVLRWPGPAGFCGGPAAGFCGGPARFCGGRVRLGFVVARLGFAMARLGFWPTQKNVCRNAKRKRATCPVSSLRNEKAGPFGATAL